MTTGVSIYLVSACTTGEEFVAAFRRYADRQSLFVPIAAPIPIGRRGRFAVTLTGGGVMIEGDAEVISSATAPSVLHGRVGMTLRFAELDDASKTVLAELEKARLVAKPAAPAVTPRVAEVPATPRPTPPAATARVDAAATLAECVAIGDVEALATTDKTPSKTGPKFVMPDVLPVGTPRPKTPSAPPEIRPKTPTAPPEPLRAKTPSIPPVMPSLAPLPGSSGIPKPAATGDSAKLAGIPKPVATSDSAKVAAFFEGDPPATPAPKPPPKSPGMKALSTMTLHGPGVPPARPPTPPAGAATVQMPAPKLTPTGMAVGGPPTVPTMTAAMPTPTPPSVTAAMPTPTPPSMTAVTPAQVAVMDPGAPAWEGATIPVSKEAAAAAIAAMGGVRVPTPLPIKPEALAADLDEATDLTSPPVAARPPSTEVPVVAPPKPVVEEATPSGDWTMVPGEAGPTIEPRKPPPTRETGDWTIQLDAGSPNGWTEPAKVAKAPEPVVLKRRPNQQENPPELAPVARSIEVEEKRFDDDDDDPFGAEEPSIQVDPTLLQGVIVDPAKVDEMVAAARASSSEIARSADAGLAGPDPRLTPPPIVAEGSPDPRRATPHPMGPETTPLPPAIVAAVAPILGTDPRLTPLPPALVAAVAPIPGTDPRLTPLPPALVAAVAPIPGTEQLTPLPPGLVPAVAPTGTDPRLTPLPPGLVAAVAPIPGTDPRIMPLPPGLVAAVAPIPGTDPRGTPLPPELAMPVDRVSASQLAAMQVPNAPGRVLTDGGVGFFRDTGEVANLSGSYQAHDQSEAKRRRRLLVIAISASLVVILGVVLVLAMAGGDKKDEEAIVAPPPPVVDARVTVVAPDAAVQAPPPPADAALPPPVEECFVDAATTPPGAEVVRDATVLGTTPARLALPCGQEVKLVVRKLKFASQVRVVTPTAAGAPLRVALQKLMFSIKVSSQPAGANISLNGKSIAMTPTTLRVPAFELSTITFSKDGYAVESFKVTPKQNNQTVHAQLKRKR